MKYILSLLSLCFSSLFATAPQAAPAALSNGESAKVLLVNWEDDDDDDDYDYQREEDPSEGSEMWYGGND